MRAATVLGVIVGGVTFGFTGFAFALFAISALALEFPPAVVVPAVMLVGDTLILMLAWEQRASLLPRRLRYVPPFSPWSAPFVLAGLVMGTLLLSRCCGQKFHCGVPSGSPERTRPNVRQLAASFRGRIGLHV